MGFIDWLRGAGSWIHNNIFKPIGRWGSGLVKGWRRTPLTAEEQGDVATRAGYGSGGLFRDVGAPLIGGLVGTVNPVAGAAISGLSKVD